MVIEGACSRLTARLATKFYIIFFYFQAVSRTGEGEVKNNYINRTVNCIRLFFLSFSLDRHSYIPMFNTQICVSMQVSNSLYNILPPIVTIKINIITINIIIIIIS